MAKLLKDDPFALSIFDELARLVGGEQRAKQIWLAVASDELQAAADLIAHYPAAKLRAIVSLFESLHQHHRPREGAHRFGGDP